MGRNTLRYQPKPDRDAEAKEEDEGACRGASAVWVRRLHVLLKREGLVINHNLSLLVMRWMHGPMNVE